MDLRTPGMMGGLSFDRGLDFWEELGLNHITESSQKGLICASYNYCELSEAKIEGGG